MTDFPLPEEGQVVVFKGMGHLDKMGRQSQRKAFFNGKWFLYKDEAFLPNEVQWWIDTDGTKHINEDYGDIEYINRVPASTPDDVRERNRINARIWRQKYPEKYRAKLDREKAWRERKKAAQTAATV